MKRVAQTARPLRIVITAGPTREPIDPVRYLSNYSTGYMGAQLAAAARAQGHRVTVVYGPGVELLPPGVVAVPVNEAREMERALRQHARRADVVIMAAAVADFRPKRAATAKLPRRGRLTLRLEAVPDIVAKLPRRSGQLVIGFALEHESVVARARRKLREKRLDLLLAQQMNGSGAPFGRRAVQAWLLARDGSSRALGRASKARIARVLLDKIEALWYGQTHRAIRRDRWRTAGARAWNKKSA